MTDALRSIIDFIRWGASEFAAAGVCLGHGHDSAVDEARHLVLGALHLPPDLPAAYGGARLTAAERARVEALVGRRVRERVPVAYLVGEAWFAGLPFRSDARALVPRSPLGELVADGFTPWLDGARPARALDLCTGSGCIGLALAAHHPAWRVDLADISAPALELARENMLALELDDGRTRIIRSDLFAALAGERYDLIVSNPPYVDAAEMAALPPEFRHEPALGLAAGADGLDLALRILAAAPEHLEADGLLVVEVGASAPALVALLPELPFEWLEFSGPATGVFALGRAALAAGAPAIAAALAARTQPPET